MFEPGEATSTVALPTFEKVERAPALVVEAITRVFAESNAAGYFGSTSLSCQENGPIESLPAEITTRTPFLEISLIASRTIMPPSLTALPNEQLITFAPTLAA